LGGDKEVEMAKASSGRGRASSAKKATAKKTTTRKTVAKASSAKTGRYVRSSTGSEKSGRNRAGRTDSGKTALFLVGEKERLDRLVGDFGNNRVAELLDVSRSQPSRWRQGKEQLSPESRRRLLDLDYVLSRLLQIYYLPDAEIWLTSFNAHLGGRPVDVLRLRGVGPVIQAIDAEAEGAYA
jgi:hypothetical protein